MANKILTLHTKSQTGTGWFSTHPIGDEEIKSIKDPDGGITKEYPTSIPSPFAYIDLVKTAFKNVGRNGIDSPRTSQIDFRLVSNALDVAEVLFNRQELGDSLKIIRWNRDNNIQALRGSQNKGQKRFADALALFFEQDEEQYNFSNFENMYLVLYKGEVIGGTSPSTLFFSAANDLSFAKIQMPNNDTLFDDQYCHLVYRDKEFQKFIFSLKKYIPGFSTLFPELDLYLEVCKEWWANNDRTGFNRDLTEASAESYETYIQAITDTTLNVEIFSRYQIGCKPSITRESSYTISPSKDLPQDNSEMPLVLVPSHNGVNMRGERMIYWGHPLSQNQSDQIPYHNSSPINERELPGVTGIQHPHLLVSDFLEPYLIQMIYPINSRIFYNNEIDDIGYLTPIKSTFFKYFTAKDLRERRIGDRPMYELKKMAGSSIKAILRIPVVNGEIIEFSRTYTLGQVPDETQNKGGIIEVQMGLAMFPAVLSNSFNNYRLMLIDNEIESDKNIKAHVFLDEQDVLGIETVIGEKVTYREPKVSISVVNNVFNNIKIKVEGSVLDAENIILINQPEQRNGTIQLTYCVDFGTTNTHIEYAIGNDAPKPLSYSRDSSLLGTLHKTDIETIEVISAKGGVNIFRPIEFNFLPLVIGRNEPSNFPQRTILVENYPLNWSNPTSPFVDTTIPTPYHKKDYGEKTVFHSNLKWSNFSNSSERKKTTNFLESLLLLIKAHALHNNANLSQLRLVWTYPVGMKASSIEKLSDTWEELTGRILPQGVNIMRTNESVTPYFFFKNTEGFVAHSNSSINIDIGGGTTDISIFSKGELNLVSSYMIGGNSLFGDGYKSDPVELNGFVQKYKSDIKKHISEREITGEQEKILSQFENKRKSTEIISFFFSIESNPLLVNGSSPILDRNELLTKRAKDDSHMKLPVLIFYYSILYHVVKTVEQHGISTPRFITFSGKGSKIVELLGNENQIKRLTRHVVSHINNEPDSINIKIGINRLLAKEVTAKGGIYWSNEASADDIHTAKGKIKHWTGLIREDISYKMLEDKALINEGINSIKEFLDSMFNFFKATDKINIYDELGISTSSVEEAASILYGSIIRESVDKGIHEDLKYIDNRNEILRASFISYYLRDALNVLSIHCSKLD